MMKCKTSIKTLAARLGVTLALALLTTATAWATVGDVVSSGTCGDKLTWTLTENEDAAVTYNSNTFTALTLTITGTGAMADYASGSDTPWWNDKIGITRLVLPDGLTHVGSDAFYGLYFATSVTLPAAVTSIGNDAFKNVGSHASSCTFTAAEGSLLSSIGTDAFKAFGGNVDLRNCTNLTTIGEKVFENYKTNKVYLPVSMRTVAKDAFYSTSYSNNKPKVYVRCQNSVLAVNGEYKTSSTGTVSTAITSYLDLNAKSSAAVSISQIRFDDIDLTWNDDGKFFAIADEQDLIDLAEYVRGGDDHGCEGVTFKMTADLDFTNMPDNYHDNLGNGSGNFLPIGIDAANGGTTFKGHFVGDGHTITGLRFNSTINTVGLFNSFYSTSATVEGVTLVSPNFSASRDVGGIVGTMLAGTVSNCAVVDGTLSVSNEAVGGIVGYSYYNVNNDCTKTISGCTVVGTTLSGSEYVGIIVGFNTYGNAANAALTISGCTYHNPAGLDVCGYGKNDRYTDGGGNQHVYQASLADGLTAATAAYSHGRDYYFTEGAAVTLGHGDRTGYDFGGYESSDVTISEGAFEMPASDVSVSAAWTDMFGMADGADGTSDHPYTISSTEGWNFFCDALLDNTTYNRFSGKTVRLGANITVTRMAGSNGHDFCGTFDGGGNTLDVNISSDDDHLYTAPFSYISNVSSVAAAIRNLNVTGTVTATKDWVSGLVGAFWGTLTIEDCTVSASISTNNKHAAGFISREQGNATIRNCRSSVSISGTVSGDGTHAGFIGGSSSGVTTAIEGCVFDGSLLGTATTHCAGFVGYNSGTLTISNSLFAPAAVSVGDANSCTFARYGTGNTVTVENSYYTRQLGTAQGLGYSLDTAPANIGTAGTAYSMSGITPYTRGIGYDGRYYMTPEAVSLSDNATNDVDGINGYFADVTLSDRRLYKDGKWNTICLPFSMTDAQIEAHTDFSGATLMELDESGKNGFDTTDGTLYLTFKKATAITAGVPYLVKWSEDGDDFTSPVFSGVTIGATAPTTVSDADEGLQEVQMVGCYSPVAVVADDKSILFLGDANTLYYSTVDRNIRSCRAYFSVPYIKGNAGAAKARTFVLNFDGEEATGILEVSADFNEKKDDAWYSLDGVRLNGKPTHRGLYINNCKKTLIK